ncbi:hypothetical protein F4677DRAFT_430394 [Hypoxylon crocopeplum]|nr:hypothetical protein F4677DRAFT_430394 [Hypoxylon crocopeplum]
MLAVVNRVGNSPGIFSEIAIASKPGDNTGMSSFTGDWNRDPSWLWPPPLYQAYCKFHFLKECSLYHLKENEDFKLINKTRTPKSRWPAVPTRVQPARRAREKKWKDHPGAPNSRWNSPTRGSESNDLDTTLEIRHKQLQLLVPWPLYKTRLEHEIKQISDKLSREDKPEANESPHLDYSPKNELYLQCRYCKFDPEVIDCEGSAPRRLAPPAPMHLTQLEDLREEQVGEFPGLKFAVDVHGEQEIITLLEMEKFSELAFQHEANDKTTSSAKEGPEEDDSGSAKATRSGKRSRTASPIEQDRKAGKPRKRRKAG